MIKLEFIQKFRRERGVNLGKCKKCQNYRFFDIFLDILHKLKKNLDQEHVKGGPPSLQENVGTIFLGIFGKMTIFLVSSLLFHPSLPKIWLSNLNKNYILK